MLGQGHPGVSFRVGRQRIGEGARIASGTVIVADELEVGEGAVIGADCDLRSARIVIGAHARVGDGTRVLAADEVALGDASVLDAGGEITCRQMTVGASTYLGARLRVGQGASMEERSTVVIGSRCQIAPDVVINPTEPVRIGDDVGFSARVALWTHGYHTGHSAQDGFTGIFDGITIEDGVWLAFDVAVLPGVTVGANTQVAARAVVTRSLPARVLAAGVPAVVKRKLAAQPLDVRERVRSVEELVRTWLSRLVFKGLTVVPDGDGQWRVTDQASGDRWMVAWRRCEGRAGVLELTAHAAVGVDVAEPIAFCFDEAGITGELDRLGHDLRDFCRRQSWFFPYDRNSAGLVPERFARLMDVRSHEAAQY